MIHNPTNRWRIQRIVPLILLLGSMTGLAHAQDQPSSAEQQTQEAKAKSPSVAANPPSFKRFHRVLGKNLTSNLFTKANLVPLLIGTAGALAISPFDERIVDEIRENLLPWARREIFLEALHCFPR